MPSQRKRIGFLPRAEIQMIIDQICKDSKLSQSKVTGILVEEALNSRGILNSHLNHKAYVFKTNKDKSTFINNDKYFNELNIKEDNLNLDKCSLKDEVQMINDFIEFKFFKNIMNKKNKH